MLYLYRTIFDKLIVSYTSPETLPSTFIACILHGSEMEIVRFIGTVKPSECGENCPITTVYFYDGGNDE